MSDRFKWRLHWILLPILLLFAFAAAWYLWNRPPPDIREYSSIQYEWQTTHPGRITEEEKEQRAKRCLEIAGKYPGSIGGLAALITASATAPDTPAGKEAYRQLAQQVEAADIGNLAQAFRRSWGQLRNIQQLAPAILARVKQAPDHPRGARLLATVCVMANPGDDGEPPSEYKEAADLIASRYADNTEIDHFCEGLGRMSTLSPPWAGRFESHLRTILEQNRDRFVRCTAKFALASVVQSSLEDRQPEAAALFEEFRSEFAGKHAYIGQMIERQLYEAAGDHLKELQTRALGKPAPEIVGIDLDDRPMTLSEYRGGVVLLNFWATWCLPCMKLIPHELELADHFQGQPFTIVGVNCDTDIEKARAAVAKNKMMWRSFRDQTDQGRAVTSHWKVLGYPTLYLLDHHGIIRKRWVGGPSDRELVHTVGVLVSAARRQVPLQEMKSVVAALRLPSEALKPAPVGKE